MISYMYILQKDHHGKVSEPSIISHGYNVF